MERLDPVLRLEVQDLFDAYGTAIDGGDFDAWLDHFVEEAEYRVISRANVERGYELATIHCESRDMLKDRAYAVRQTMMYEPRYLRHVIGSARLRSEANGKLEAEASYSVFESLVDEETRVLQVGRYDARVVRGADGVLRFARLQCVFDSSVVPNSLIYPI